MRGSLERMALAALVATMKIEMPTTVAKPLAGPDAEDHQENWHEGDERLALT